MSMWYTITPESLSTYTDYLYPKQEDTSDVKYLKENAFRAPLLVWIVRNRIGGSSLPNTDLSRCIVDAPSTS